MTPRFLALAVALLVATPLLAGCMAGAADDPPERAGAAAPGDGAFAPVDAKAALDVASAAAREWHANATLRSVFATEGVPVDLEDPPFLFDSRADADVGDGLASAWTFIYRTEDADTSFVVAVRGGEDAPTYARALTLPPYLPYGIGGHDVHARSRPVGDFTASSDAAFAVASNATVQSWLADHPVNAARLLLVHDGDGPAWHVTRFTSAGFVLIARVDATDASLTDIARYPDDWLTPCDGCGPEQPPTPTPPEKPPTQVIERTITLTSFDPYGEMLVPVEHARYWRVNVTVTADVPGEAGLEDRTLRLRDQSWWTLDESTGTGALTVGVQDADGTAWSEELLVELAPGDTPVVRDQEVALRAVVEYGAPLAHDRHVWVDGFGGHVGFRQSTDHPVRVTEHVEELRVAVQTYEDGAVRDASSGDVTFTLLAPNGTEVARVERGGELVVKHPAPGAFTFRAVSGDGNVFGTSFEARVTQIIDWSREDADAESAPVTSP